MSPRTERRPPVSKAALFAALGDETRLRLIDRLADGKGMPIGALCQGADFTRQAMTKHLRVPERAGFVRAKRVGRETRFAYQPSALDDAQKALDEIGRRWEQALDRLQALVEAENK